MNDEEEEYKNSETYTKTELRRIIDKFRKHYNIEEISECIACAKKVFTENSIKSRLKTILECFIENKLKLI